MYALGMVASETGTDTSLAWLLWIVLGIIALTIAVGWGAARSGSQPGPDEGEPIPRNGTVRGRIRDRKTVTRAVSGSKRKSNGK